MNKLNSPEELKDLRREIKEKREREAKPCITVSCGSESIPLGSEKIFDELEREIEKQELEDEIDSKKSCCDCPGISEKGPLAVVFPDEICYVNIKPEDIPEIVQSVKNGEVVDRLLYTTSEGEKIESYWDIPFFKNQERLLLRNTPEIDPRNIKDYIALGGYGSLSKALFEMSPEEIIKKVKEASLRGRGGAGFPAGRKWETTRSAEGEPKYVVVNCDEGDPGVYMDRTLMEGNPHSVLEGLAIGAYAIGSNEGYFYVREEFLAAENVELAIEQAEEYGLLGEDILGSGFSLQVEVHRAAGAFVSGEESALMRAVEGKVSEPRVRYIFPAEGGGLWNRPTNINNVETWANVPLIIEKGAKRFRSIGTENSKGTKIFSLVGNVNNTGLVEVPMGITLREIIYEIGGGIKEKKKFKAVQTGGPLGGFIPENYLDTPVDFDELKKLGSMMGSGGMVVFDEDTCMVDMAKFFTDFNYYESCGKCTPCRNGLKQMLHLLDKICSGEADEEDIKLLEELALYERESSTCGLGKSAPNPVLTTLEYFREEYVDHIKRQKCSAGVCSEIVKSPCQNTCPAGTNVPGYIQLIKEKRYIDAYNLSREDNPFTGVLSRICPRPCEAKCERDKIDESVAIRDLKGFIADYRFEHEDEYRKSHQISRLQERGKDVAILGTGPGGLSAAYFLRRLGYDVTVFEASDKPVKKLVRRYEKITDLPGILEKETQDILDLGMEIEDVLIRNDASIRRLLKDFDAIFIAAGTSPDRTLGTAGEIPEETLQKHQHAHQTSIDKIFVSGDIPVDAWFFVKSVGDGKEAAGMIDEFLSGKDHLEELKSLIDYDYGMKAPKIEENIPRRKIGKLDEEACLNESARCLRCDLRIRN